MSTKCISALWGLKLERYLSNGFWWGQWNKKKNTCLSQNQQSMYLIATSNKIIKHELTACTKDLIYYCSLKGFRSFYLLRSKSWFIDPALRKGTGNDRKQPSVLTFSNRYIHKFNWYVVKGIVGVIWKMKWERKRQWAWKWETTRRKEFDQPEGE